MSTSLNNETTAELDVSNDYLYGQHEGNDVKFSASVLNTYATIIDSNLSSTSENPVQNKVVTESLNNKVSKSGDTMTGPITFNKSGISFHAIKAENNNGCLQVTGGTSATTSAMLQLSGDSFTGSELPAGAFDLQPAGSNIRLRGTTDGVLSWNGTNITCTTFEGTATRAKWADLAEYYLMDKTYSVGTLVCFGGKKEMTIATDYANAVISDKPALLMNTAMKDRKNAQPVALMGRVKVRVLGKVKKFDLIGLDPEHPGVAKKVTNKDLAIGRVLKGKNDSEESLVLCTVKMEI